MILIHASLVTPGPDEEDDFEGHQVKLLMPGWLKPEDREALERLLKGGVDGTGTTTGE